MGWLRLVGRDVVRWSRLVGKRCGGVVDFGWERNGGVIVEGKKREFYCAVRGTCPKTVKWEKERRGLRARAER